MQAFNLQTGGISMNDELLYTVREVSKLLKVNVNFVYKLINKKLLPCLILGSKKVYRKDLIKFIEKHRNKDLTDLDNIKDIK